MLVHALSARIEIEKRCAENKLPRSKSKAVNFVGCAPDAKFRTLSTASTNEEEFLLHIQVSVFGEASSI